MSADASPWTTFAAQLAEARRAASEGRYYEFTQLTSQLTAAAVNLPPLPPDESSLVHRELTALTGVLGHIAAVKGALSGLRVDAGVYGVPQPRTLDQRG